jgi:hypothetical protein
MRKISALKTLSVAKIIECGSIEHWWNGNDWGKPKYTKINLPI